MSSLKSPLYLNRKTDDLFRDSLNESLLKNHLFQEITCYAFAETIERHVSMVHWLAT